MRRRVPRSRALASAATKAVFDNKALIALPLVSPSCHDFSQSFKQQSPPRTAGPEVAERLQQLSSQPAPRPFPKLKFKGKGHEAADLRRLLSKCAP